MAQGPQDSISDAQWNIINRMSMGFAFLLTQPGVPLIYYGDEVGLAGAADPDNRRMMRFSELDEEERATRDHVSAWNRLRRSHMSLMYGQTDIAALPTGLLRIERQYLSETVTVYINPTRDAKAIEVMGDILLGGVEDGQLPGHACIAIAGAS